MGKITSGSRGKTATVVCAINAIGTYVPTMIFFPRKRLPMIMMAGAPPGAIGACSDSGWIDSTIFVNWLRHFVEFTKASNENQLGLQLRKFCLHLPYFICL